MCVRSPCWPGGLESLGLRLLAVTDSEGRPYDYESSHPGSDLKLKIWIPGAENASRTAVITYRLKRGLRFYPDHDAFNWIVTGKAWEVPIERASARVQLTDWWQGGWPCGPTTSSCCRGKRTRG